VIEQPEGTTPLDPTEAEGLVPSHITTRAELNVWENQNILAAMKWLESRRPGNELTDRFIRDLHRRMFDETWEWAGTYRRSDKNIGVHWPEIPVVVRDLCGDGRYWLDNTVYPPRQAVARVHHRLVAIHCFPDGNGRHARLHADALLRSMGEEPFTWGRGDLHVDGAPRDAYLAALRAADGGRFDELFSFLGCT